MTFETQNHAPLCVLESISCSISEGDFAVFLGPSGCGKTTLLNIAAGFLKPTRGEVTLDSVPVTGPGAERGVVFQSGALFQWLTVFGNAEFGLKMRGVPENERKEKVESLLELVGLKDFRDYPVHKLSGGMRQRLALVRCLVNNPSIILMDEPFGALDAFTRDQMQMLVFRIWKQTGRMILFITHNVEEALVLGTDIYVLTPSPGTISEHITPGFSLKSGGTDLRAVKSDPDFVRMREEILSCISLESE
jgi:taurine transport system ATP-binding protein